MSYQSKADKSLEVGVNKSYKEVRGLVRMVNRKDITADSAQASAIVEFNRNIVDNQAKLETGSFYDSLVYSKVNPDLESILGKLHKRMVEPSNRQFAVIVPKSVYNQRIEQNTINAYNAAKNKTGNVNKVELKDWLKEQFKTAKKSNNKLNYSEFIKNKYGQGLVCGSSSDLGIVLPRYYKVSDKIVELPRSKLQDIVNSYEGISLKEVNGAYVISADKKLSVPKLVTEAILGVAGITVAYNALTGNLDFSSPAEILKNFCILKYNEHGELPSGNVDLDFKEGTHVTGMTIQDGAVDGLTFQDTHVTGMTIQNGAVDGLSFENTQVSGLSFENANLSGLSLENAQISNGSGTINGNFELFDQDGTLINFGNFDAYTDLTGIHVNPDGAITLDGFTGTISGNITDGTLTGDITDGTLTGDITDGTITGGITDGTLTGSLTQGTITGGITDGTLMGGLNGIITWNGALNIAKIFPSYVVQAGVFTAGVLKGMYDGSKRVSSVSKDLEAIMRETISIIPKDDAVGTDDTVSTS